VSTHFVGIGGIGMSGLARVLHARGAAVSGCDRADGPVLDGLRALGIACAAPHDPAHLAGCARVVASSAIDPAEPELVRARELGLPLLHRSEVLAEILVAHRRRVVVTGAHGKTTTTAMIAYALDRLGLAPTFVVGGEVGQLGGNAGAGSGDVCVAEGDESDRSVARLPADVAVVLNVDLDHLDHYASVAEVVELLSSWTARLPADGLLVAGDGVVLDTDAAVERFGLGPGEGLRALAAEAGADGLSFAPSSGGRATLALHGLHNAANACAAALVLRRLGVGLDEAFAALATFAGTGRRFEAVGERAGVRVVDDYAHHPAELAATLAAGRAQRPARLVVYFQPHMPWRTRAFAAAFADALTAADVVVVGETYVARGAPDPGATARAIVQRLRRAAPGVDATFAADEEEAVAALRARVRAGDLVLCCGAGPVDRVARRLVAA
jgi:UDP-N-acetylmuramate--alanine ligase